MSFEDRVDGIVFAILYHLTRTPPSIQDNSLRLLTMVCRSARSTITQEASFIESRHRFSVYLDREFSAIQRLLTHIRVVPDPPMPRCWRREAVELFFLELKNAIQVVKLGVLHENPYILQRLSYQDKELMDVYLSGLSNTYNTHPAVERHMFVNRAFLSLNIFTNGCFHWHLNFPCHGYCNNSLGSALERKADISKHQAKVVYYLFYVERLLNRFARIACNYFFYDSLWRKAPSLSKE